MKILLPLLLLNTHGPTTQSTLEISECAATTYEATVLEREGEWPEPPDVLLCHGGPVSMHRLRKAVNYWENLGYNFGTVSEALRDNYACATGNVPYGTIMIDIPGQTFKMGKHLGSTKTWKASNPEMCSTAPEILKAKIEIISAWGNSERILEHEIGHALGWNDISITGHIMNSAWASGGYNSRGLRK